MGKKKVKFKPLSIIFILTFIIALIGVISFAGWSYLKSPVDVSDNNKIEFEVKSGTTSTEIANNLKSKDLIKSVSFFKLYLKINGVSSLKASNYSFSKSMSLDEIVSSLEKGVISNKDAIKVTLPDGERITKFADIISKKFDMNYDEIINNMKDREYIKKFIPDYWFLTDSILDSNIYYPLEGYLAPETYYFDKNSTLDVIITRMLKQTESNLEEYKAIMESNPHYYMTMASILQLEGTNTENRKMIAGVFINRLNNGYNLGSDVTTYYALQADMKRDLTKDEFAVVNPYNTRGGGMIGKMPVGPICNPGISSIEASCNPDKNDYYFFVADKNGKIYYTKTNREHEQKVAEIKAAGNWIFD